MEEEGQRSLHGIESKLFAETIRHPRGDSRLSVDHLEDSEQNTVWSFRQATYQPFRNHSLRGVVMLGRRDLIPLRVAISHRELTHEAVRVCKGDSEFRHHEILPKRWIAMERVINCITDDWHGSNHEDDSGKRFMTSGVSPYLSHEQFSII